MLHQNSNVNRILQAIVNNQESTTQKSTNKILIMQSQQFDLNASREHILTMFINSFWKQRIKNTTGKFPYEYKYEELIQIAGDMITDDINEKIIVAEIFAFRLFKFCNHYMGKIIIHPQKNIEFIPRKNRQDTYSKQEMNFYKTAVDEIVLFGQNCVIESNLTEIEEDKWDTDILHFLREAYQAEIIYFDQKVELRDMIRNVSK